MNSDKSAYANSFLYSSLNMEIVYSFLKGINVQFKRESLQEFEYSGVTDADYKETKFIQLS